MGTADWCADELGTRAGAALARGVGVLLLVGDREEQEVTVIEPLTTPSVESAAMTPKRVVGTHSRPPAAAAAIDSIPRSEPAAVPRGLRISAETVLRLAESGARPSGVPVPASGSRPAGVQLSNVGGLGIGLRDGDILVTAAGGPASDAAGVVERILRARGTGTRVLTGEVWRAGVLFPIAVEQPYPGADGAGSAADIPEPASRRP